MAKRPGNAARVWAWHYDYSSVLNNMGLDVTQATPDVTTFSDAGPRVVTDNYGYKFNGSGFWTTDTQFDSNRFTKISGGVSDSSVTNLWSYLPEGDTEGLTAYDMYMIDATYSMGAQVGNAQTASFSAMGRAGLSRGKILRNATITGTNIGTGYSTVATSSGQEYRIIIRSFSGSYTTFDVRIEHSDDDAATDPYTSIAALEQTGITTDTAFTKSTTGATKLWKRVRVLTWTGTNVILGVTGGYVAGTATGTT